MSQRNVQEERLLAASVEMLNDEMKNQNGTFFTFNAPKGAVMNVLRVLEAALGTLNALGYTYHGGALFKPPLGPASVLHAEGVLEDLVQEVRKTVQEVWAGADVVKAKEANDAAEFFKNELMRLVRERHRAS